MAPSRLVHAAQQVLPVVAHAGGMMSGANRQSVSAQLRNYVMPHDRRIAEYTGQPFGEAYFEGLLRDHTAVFDSTPPIGAVMAAEAIEARPGDARAFADGALCRRTANCRSSRTMELAAEVGYARRPFPCRD